MNRARELLRRPAGGVESKKDSRKKDETLGGNGNSSRTASSPRKSSRDGTHGASSSNGSDDGQRWKQKLTDTKLFQRLLQPAHIGQSKSGSNSGGGNHHSSDPDVVPRLGEVPVRSKYFRAEQQKPHFATTENYLPLAEICGPPVQPSNTDASQPGRRAGTSRKHRSRSHKRHRRRHGRKRRSSGGDGDAPYDGLEDYEASGDDAEGDDDRGDGNMEDSEDEGGDDDVYDSAEEEEEAGEGEGELDGGDAAAAAAALDRNVGFDYGFGQADDGHHNSSLQQHMSEEESNLRENLVRAIPGSMRRRNYSSTGSATSAASSIGPTGLALLPQFRWVPHPGGGGHGFNPLIAFRRPQPQQQQQQQYAHFYSTGHYNVHAAPATLHQQPPHGRDGESPLQYSQQQDEGKMAATLSAVAGAHSGYDMFYNTPSPAPQRNSFYGPIGTLGIEASRRRRQLELENGAEGDAEKAYKARTSRRSSRFDDGSILIITKAWCDPNLLLSARFVDSPRLPPSADDDNDSSSSDSAGNIMDWDSGSDDAAGGGKPPAYDTETMAAREARVRKERIKQEKRRSQPAESPSFYFAGEELAGLRPPPDDAAAGGNGATGGGGGGGTAAAAKMAPMPPAPSPPARERAAQTTTKASPPSKRVEDENDADEGSSSSSSKSSDNSSSDDEDDEDESNTNSDSDSPSDNSSDSENSDGEEEEEEEDYCDSDSGRSPRDDSTTRAPAHGQRQRQHLRGPPADVSFSTGPTAAIGRSVAADQGQYDFMNSSMMCGPGGSLFLPHDDNESSMGGTGVVAPSTPFHRPGAAHTPLHGANGGAGERPSPSAQPVPLKSPANHYTAIPTISPNNLTPAGADKGHVTERPASGNGAAAANALRDKKKVKKVSPDTRAGTRPQQRVAQSGSTNSAVDDGGAGEMSIYGGSFHLRDARSSYSPADYADAEGSRRASFSPSSPDSRAMTHSPSNNTTTRNGSAVAAAPTMTSTPSTSPAPASATADARRDHLVTPSVHASRGTTESPVGFSMPARGTFTSPAIHGGPPSRNPSISPPLHNNGRRTSAASPAGISTGTGEYNSRPSSMTPCVSPPHQVEGRPDALTPQPPADGRRLSHVPSPNITHVKTTGNGACPTNTAGNNTTAGQQKGGVGNVHLGSGYYAPMTPPGTPKMATPMQSARDNGSASPVTRGSANVSVTPALGESTHLNDHNYEMPGSA
jgi:hypothetical protein